MWFEPEWCLWAITAGLMLAWQNLSKIKTK